MFQADEYEYVGRRCLDEMKFPNVGGMTVPLFLTCCAELGIGVAELDRMSIGLVRDIWAEKLNADISYARLATQEDFAKF